MTAAERNARFWEAFLAFPLGPIPAGGYDLKDEADKGSGRYKRYGANGRFGLHCVLKVTDDTVGVELKTNNRADIAAVKELFEQQHPSAQIGELEADIRSRTSFAKIFIDWQDVDTTCEDRWPAYFLWLRLAMYELCETYVPHMKAFSHA
ncbi:hypothetical protein [Aliiroseovarius crassostreae]|uniref:hypothetical protein n=1 Tax=Aliiroseovarius crassostreae TaxID=154981 RepID=UPI0022030C3F|nr:hypothetical protein [Aliiroseovarius crassostreae]UWQ07389.1 hypothetical protein K3X25_11505 [Aliiroseovarius crassostreae]